MSDRAFANGTEFEIWSFNWCDRCKKDDMEREVYCPILTNALFGETTPTEWVGPRGDYECTAFEGRNAGC